MKKIVTTILLILLLSSCGFGKKGIDVFIKNNTENTIYDVSVSASASNTLKYDSIIPNQSITTYLDMTEMPRIDGSYTFKFTYANGDNFSNSFGYYTNGWPNNYSICCSVRDIAVYTLLDEMCE